ncbi:D-aminoacyl-tRNA deacylase, partial [Salmonella sp. s54925]|uniref:D-aminoacyl-tRNA deacylase n=1 Tax=Salmonella sp. s54925 TaxID=3159674 RepID=UPI00397FF942
MRAIIQRVKRASVTVDGEVVSCIKQGLCVLVGICNDDTRKDLEYIVNKVLKLRLFEEDGKRWKKSVMDLDYEVLCVSQFTLMSVLKGNKPDFHKAMDGELSKHFYEEF